MRDEVGRLRVFGSLLEAAAMRWDAELGIDVRVVVPRTTSRSLPEIAEQLLRDRKPGITGSLVIVLDPAGRRAHVEVTESLDAALPAPVLARTALQQLAPYAEYDSAGLATLGALRHLEDFALAKLAAGDWKVADSVRERSALQLALSEIPPGTGTSSDLARFARIESAPEASARYAPSAEPLQSAERFLRAMSEGGGDPVTPLLTAQSQVQLARDPGMPFQYWKRRDTVRASRPLRVLVRGQRAVITSDTPTRGFVPILLQRIEGLWLVDLVETWKNLQLDGKGQYRVTNRNNPYMFGLASLPAHGWQSLEPMDSSAHPERSIPALEIELAKHATPELHFRLAEILFRDCFVPLDALSHYEAAVRASPETELYARTLADRAAYLGLHEYSIPFYEALGAPAYESLGDAYFGLDRYTDAARYYELATKSSSDHALRLQSKLDQARRRTDRDSSPDQTSDSGESIQPG